MNSINKESMAGFLVEYANPSLVEKEKTAWQQAMVDKYRNERNTSFSYLTPYEILRYEFDGEPQSFLFQLRGNLVWDKVAFYRLVTAMYQVAEDFENRENLPKWIAQGFWFIETFSKDWTQHENFPKPEENYHTNALEILNNLSYYLFVGERVEIDFTDL